MPIRSPTRKQFFFSFSVSVSSLRRKYETLFWTRPSRLLCVEKQPSRLFLCFAYLNYQRKYNITWKHCSVAERTKSDVCRVFSSNFEDRWSSTWPGTCWRWGHACSLNFSSRGSKINWSSSPSLSPPLLMHPWHAMRSRSCRVTVNKSGCEYVFEHFLVVTWFECFAGCRGWNDLACAFRFVISMPWSPNFRFTADEARGAQPRLLSMLHFPSFVSYSTQAYVKHFATASIKNLKILNLLKKQWSSSMSDWLLS